MACDVWLERSGPMRKLLLFPILIVSAALASGISLPFNVISMQYAHCAEVDLKLPNVLLIGDSTQIRYYPEVREALRGKANVFRIVELAPQRAYSLIYGGPLLQPVNAGSTRLATERLSEWLGHERWDVVHFNWGLHDLILGDKSDANNQRADQAVQAYRQNLKLLISRLKETRAQLVLATTTPVSPDLGYSPAMVEAFNEAAKRASLESNILVNDLYAATYPRLSELQYSNDVHFNNSGTTLLAHETASSISTALSLSAQREGRPKLGVRPLKLWTSKL